MGLITAFPAPFQAYPAYPQIPLPINALKNIKLAKSENVLINGFMYGTN